MSAAFLSQCWCRFEGNPASFATMLCTQGKLQRQRSQKIIASVLHAAHSDMAGTAHDNLQEREDVAGIVDTPAVPTPPVTLSPPMAAAVPLLTPAGHAPHCSAQPNKASLPSAFAFMCPAKAGHKLFLTPPLLLHTLTSLKF
jgi:hypothetical protein